MVEVEAEVESMMHHYYQYIGAGGNILLTGLEVDGI